RRRCTPAGTLRRRYRPSVLVTAPRFVPGMTTAAPATGLCVFVARTWPVTVPWAAPVPAVTARRAGAISDRRQRCRVARVIPTSEDGREGAAGCGAGRPDHPFSR